MFKFELGQQVKVSISGEEGKVKGRGEYIDSASQYWLHIKGADGRAVNAWFYESEIEAVSSQAG